MKLFLTSVIIILSFFSIGCVATSGHTNTSTLKLSTRVFINDKCLITHKIGDDGEAAGLGAALVGALVPVVVDYAIGLIVKKMTEIQKDTSSGSGVIDLYEISKNDVGFPVFSPKFSCITVLTGEFDDTNESGFLYRDIKPFNASETERKDYSKLKQHLSDNEFTLAPNGEIYAVYEFSLNPSQDKTAFRVENRYLHINKLLENRRSRELMYTFQLQGPGVNDAGVEYLTITEKFGEVKPNIVKIGDDFGTNKISDPYAYPAISKPSWLAILRDFNKVDNKWDALSNQNKRYMPAKAIATMIQLKNPSDADKFFAKLLEAAKSPLSSAIVGKLAPPDNTQAIYDAKIAYQSAINELENAGTEASGARKLAELKKEKACELLVTLGESCD